MKYLNLFLLFILIISCSKDDDSVAVDTLESYVLNKTVETGAVIACAASEENSNDVLTFYYPKIGATNVKLYITEGIDVNPLNYSKYMYLKAASTPVFNGYLGRFKTNKAVEHFVIISYELDNEIKISNPIRTKQHTKETYWSDEVTVNQEDILMPKFSWENNQVGDNAIYFQVLSSVNNDLISGTYTTENNFQFYSLTNVVLNITMATSPELVVNTNYNFTLMDVSEDNWVNLVHQKTFITP